MYKELAKYYDIIYSWKEYKKEINRINKLIKKYKLSEGNKLLDVGCGTGKHLQYFKDNYLCTGIDLNNEMINIAKTNISNVTFTQANMIDFDLNDTYDIIICLFSSIGYIKTYENLEKTILNFAKHLNPGGIVIIEPWFTISTFKTGHPGMTTYDGENIKIARVNSSSLKENISIMEMHYLIAEKDKEVKYFVDKHELGLFEVDRFLKILTNSGFKAEFLKDGLMKHRGLYIGIKT